jgi:HTH-type transcriptional regulator / antitoxin HipB
MSPTVSYRLPIGNTLLDSDQNITYIPDRERKGRFMDELASKLPSGNPSLSRHTIRSAAELGALARKQRQMLGLKQGDVAGLGNTGNRFMVDLERGKPTLQLQKTLDVLDLLGLEVVIQPKSGGAA